MMIRGATTFDDEKLLGFFWLFMFLSSSLDTLHSFLFAVFWDPFWRAYFCGLYFTYPCLSYF